MTLEYLQQIINHAYEAGGQPSREASIAVDEVLDHLDQGTLRAAEQLPNGEWRANEWVKKAILLYFRKSVSETTMAGPFEYYDKVPVKTHLSKLGIRVLPGAVIRKGTFIGQNAVILPSFLNIGCRVGSRTMIDTWATVGSCAQVGDNCHISGGVGIGGVLEPLQATPVIIEDDVFIGARSEIAEGVIVKKRAVLAMGCYVAASTKIYDARTHELLPYGVIPEGSVCVPGALPSADGSHSTYAIIIKKYRDEKTDARTSLNEVLR